MKLSAERIDEVLDQLEAETVVVPESHPKAGDLHEVFGDHTFFLDRDGLEIVEPARLDDADEPQHEGGQVVKLAMWNDAARTVLAPHPAEFTGVVIHFQPHHHAQLDQAGEDSFPASDATFHGGITDANDH